MATRTLFRPQVAGGRAHTEHWISAEQLDDFNDHIVGAIEVIAEFPRDGRPGEVSA